MSPHFPHTRSTSPPHPHTTPTTRTRGWPSLALRSVRTCAAEIQPNSRDHLNPPNREVNKNPNIFCVAPQYVLRTSTQLQNVLVHAEVCSAHVHSTAECPAARRSADCARPLSCRITRQGVPVICIGTASMLHGWGDLNGPQNHDFWTFLQYASWVILDRAQRPIHNFAYNFVGRCFATCSRVLAPEIIEESTFPAISG